MFLAGKGVFPLEPVLGAPWGQALAQGPVPTPRSPWLHWVAVAPQGTPLVIVPLPCHLSTPGGSWTVALGRVGACLCLAASPAVPPVPTVLG